MVLWMEDFFFYFSWIYSKKTSTVAPSLRDATLAASVAARNHLQQVKYVDTCTSLLFECDFIRALESWYISNLFEIFLLDAFCPLTVTWI